MRRKANLQRPTPISASRVHGLGARSDRRPANVPGQVRLQRRPPLDCSARPAIDSRALAAVQQRRSALEDTPRAPVSTRNAAPRERPRMIGRTRPRVPDAPGNHSANIGLARFATATPKGARAHAPNNP